MTLAPATQDRTQATLTWFGIVGGALVAIAALHSLGDDPAYAIEWSSFWQWLDGPPDRILLALGRIAALALAYYVAASTLLYTVARATRIPGLIRSVEWATLPMLRRVAERTVAVSLTVSTLAGGSIGPALAQSDGSPVPTPVIQHVSDDGAVDVPVPFATPGSLSDEEAPAVSTPRSGEEEDRVVLPPWFVVSTPQDETAPQAEVGPRFIDPTAADAVGVVAAAGQKSASLAYDYVVVKGDNMWLAAERHLEDVMGRAPTDAETATYWSHMIEVNRPLIRSGDPDLIYPGEVIVCPAVDEAGL